MSTSSLTNAVPRSNDERDVGDAPAVVLRADAVRDRHAHVVRNTSAELRRAEHGLERAHLDAGQVHRQDQPRDALCFGASGSVRTRNSPTSAIWPNEHQIFWPLST